MDTFMAARPPLELALGVSSWVGFYPSSRDVSTLFSSVPDGVLRSFRLSQSLEGAYCQDFQSPGLKGIDRLGAIVYGFRFGIWL